MNKRIISVVTLVTLLVLPVPSVAQQSASPGDGTIACGDRSRSADLTSRPSQTYDTHFWSSSAAYWGGFTVDALSSKGHAEANPLFRSRSGTANIGLNAAVTGGFYAFTVWLQRRHPKAASAMRYGFGGIRFGVAIRNWTY